MAGPSKRKERRQAAASASTSVPLSHPDRSAPRDGKAKTLYDLAAEREQLLSNGTPFSVADGKDDEDDDEPLGPLAACFFLAVSLTMFHFTLDVLVHNQYRQSIEWGMIAPRTLKTFPVILALLYTARRLTTALPALLTQLLFVGLSVGAGCYLIRASNVDDYYAVMKRAPPLGALWVWSVVELRLGWALLSLAVDYTYMYLAGYSFW
ncbi:MAG: hypothetical protein M1832_004261 [Thelocarpon impressellum]|nr:MAG: hypothetical protein M1832_004261 [Thelocarpon impressellum]